MDLQEAVDLRVINDITFFFYLIPNTLETIAAKLLLENGFYILQDNSVINQLDVPHSSGRNYMKIRYFPKVRRYYISDSPS